MQQIALVYWITSITSLEFVAFASLWWLFQVYYQWQNLDELERHCFRRWDSNFENLIRDSRIHPTESLVKAIAAAENPPKVFVSASAVGKVKIGKMSVMALMLSYVC